MRVFRLQHRTTGRGPYAEQAPMGFDLNEVCGGMNARNCPEPDNDLRLRLNFNSRFPNCLTIGGNISGGYLFGFLDEAQLKKWFGSSGIMRLLAHHGFEVAVKEISHRKVIKGESQCMIESDAWFEAETVDRWIPERYVGRWSYDEAIA